MIIYNSVVQWKTFIYLASPGMPCAYISLLIDSFTDNVLLLAQETEQFMAIMEYLSIMENYLERKQCMKNK